MADPRALQGRPDVLTRVVTWIAERPRVGCLLLVALLGAAIFGLIGTGSPPQLEEGDAWSVAFDTDQAFGLDRPGGSLVLFGDVESAAGSIAARSAADAVEALPWVNEVVTPWDLPGAAGESLRDLATRRIVRDIFMPRERAGLLAPFTLKPNFDVPEHWESALDWEAETVDAARRAIVDGGGAELKIQVGITGQQSVIVAQETAFGTERWRFMGFGALLGFLIASASFRNVRATFLAGLPPILGVVLSVGLARAVGLGADGFTTIVLPLLVLTIGFADSLHLVVAMVKSKEAGAATGGEAGCAAIRDLTWPCALTSLTTAIGFASLALSGHGLVVEFGLSCALATAVTFVTVVITTPLLARTPLGARLDAVRPPGFDRTDQETSGVIASVIAWFLRYPRAVSLVGLALTVGFAAVAAGLDADRRVMTDLAEGSSAATTLMRVDSELGGIFPMNVRMDWDEGVSSEDLQRASTAAAECLRLEPLVAGVVGPASILEVFGNGAPWPALALVPESWRAPFVSLEGRRALLHARVPDAGSQALIPVFERIRARLAEIELPGIKLQLVGTHVAYLETVDEVTLDLRRSLALAALLILVTLAIAFRSWRLGLASVVPNLLPIGVSAAGLALTGGHIDVSTLTALTLSLGIATDDTIHVLARWQRTATTEATPLAAARAAILRTLPALTMTTLTLTAAFGQLLTSALPTIREFGLLASITLVVAFVADALLLPSLLVVLDGRRVR